MTVLREKESTAFFEKQPKYSDKLWWKEMEQNVQRALIVKSFKKPVKISMKFIISYLLSTIHNVKSLQC